MQTFAQFSRKRLRENDLRIPEANLISPRANKPLQ
jgi:hypothetical protein